MPDVVVKCPECGADRVVSEYASVESFNCLVCQAELDMPGREASTGGLELKRNPGPRSVPMPLTQVEPPESFQDDEEDPVSAAAAAAAAPAVDVHSGREVDVKSTAWLGWLGFILVAGLLIGFQWKQSEFSQYETYYVWARNILVLGSYFMVVLIAFQDHAGVGALNLIFPPYSLIYVSGSLESYLLRGVFLACVIALGTEVYFLGDESLLSTVGAHMGQWIDKVDSLIKRASE